MSHEPGIIDRLLDLPGETDPRAATFARGLVLGALVGAAVAGSTIWQRRQARRVSRSSPATSASPSGPSRSTPVAEPSEPVSSEAIAEIDE